MHLAAGLRFYWGSLLHSFRHTLQDYRHGFEENEEGRKVNVNACDMEKRGELK